MPRYQELDEGELTMFTTVQQRYARMLNSRRAIVAICFGEAALAFAIGEMWTIAANGRPGAHHDFLTTVGGQAALAGIAFVCNIIGLTQLPKTTAFSYVVAAFSALGGGHLPAPERVAVFLLAGPLLILPMRFFLRILSRLPFFTVFGGGTRAQHAELAALRYQRDVGRGAR